MGSGGGQGCDFYSSTRVASCLLPGRDATLHDGFRVRPFGRGSCVLCLKGGKWLNVEEKREEVFGNNPSVVLPASCCPVPVSCDHCQSQFHLFSGVSNAECGTLSCLSKITTILVIIHILQSIMPTSSREQFHCQPQNHTGFCNCSAFLFSWGKPRKHCRD